MATMDDSQENTPQEAAIDGLVADYQKRGFSSLQRYFVRGILADSVKG